MDQRDFTGLRANYDTEIELFNYRNKIFVHLFPKLNDSLDAILGQVRTRTDQHLEIVIHMLVRLCSRHYEAIFLLVTCGHGFSASRILRSLFEKYVDAEYLRKNPAQIDDFWDYHMFNIIADCDAASLALHDPNYETKLDRFYTINSNGKKRKRPQWSTMGLVSKAQAIGLEDPVIEFAYRLPSHMIHSSMREILASFVLENDGSISPVSESSEKERIYADECLTISTNIMVTALSLLIDHFGLSTPNEFAEFCDEYRTFVNGKSS